MINDLQYKLRLDGELSNINMLIGAYDMRDSQHLNDVSIGAAPTEASTNVLDTDEMMNVDDDVHYASKLEDDPVLNEILAGGTACAQPSYSVSAKHLFKI